MLFFPLRGEVTVTVSEHKNVRYLLAMEIAYQERIQSIIKDGVQGHYQFWYIVVVGGLLMAGLSKGTPSLVGTERKRKFTLF